MPPRKKPASRKPKTPAKKQTPPAPDAEPIPSAEATVDQTLVEPESTSSQKSVRKSARIAKTKTPVEIQPNFPRQSESKPDPEPEINLEPEPESVADQIPESSSEINIEPEPQLPQLVAEQIPESKSLPESMPEQIPESKPEIESVPERIPESESKYESMMESGFEAEPVQESASKPASMPKEISELVPEPKSVTLSSSAMEMVTESAPEPATVSEEIPESVPDPELVTKSASAAEELSESVRDPGPQPESMASSASTTIPVPDSAPEIAAVIEPVIESVSEPNQGNASKSPNTDNETAETQMKESVTDAPEEATGKKKVIKVRKVIKKKIVKKLVPKTLIEVAKEEAKEFHKVEREPEKTAGMNSNNEANQVNEDINIDVKKEEKTADELKDVHNVKDESENKISAINADSDAVVVSMEKPKECNPESEKQCTVDMEDSEKKRRKKTEIFIGGLDRNAKENDLRKVFGEVGEIVEVRMIMDVNSGMNKGFAFVRYADANQAKVALERFNKVEVCGKLCGASALKGNDTIFLGNIDRKWKKEDIMKLLLDAGIEKIEDISIMPDLHHSGSNRGFALLELQTNKDAHNAFKTLQKKDVFGKGLNVKVAWAEPLNDPDEEELKKVKSVYVEGIPTTWSEEQVREQFIKFGEIERIVLARNIDPAKKKDFVFVNYKTRDAALSCIESFSADELTADGSKINVKVSLAKPAQREKQHKSSLKFGSKDKIIERPKLFQRDTKTSSSSSMGNVWGRSVVGSHNTLSQTHEYSNVRPHVTWPSGQTGYAGGPASYNYPRAGVKRPFSSMGDEHLYSDNRSNPRARLNMYPTPSPSYGSMPRGVAGSSYPYYQHPDAGYSAGVQHGTAGYPPPYQMRQGAPMPPPPPYGNNYRPRY